MFKELFGKLPKRTGWQPVLPRVRSAIRDLVEVPQRFAVKSHHVARF